MGDSLDELLAAITAARQSVLGVLSERDRAGLERAEIIIATQTRRVP